MKHSIRQGEKPGQRLIICKSPAQIEKIAGAGEILAGCLSMLRGECRPGTSTGRLDELAEAYIREKGATPTFKGYRGFPASICASPNEVVVHGIPGKYVLREGDIISIDVGVTHNGWVADAAVTVAVGEVSKLARRLMEVCEESLMRAIAKCMPGNHLGDVCHTIEEHVVKYNFSVVRTLVGHGVGKDMHEEPQIPNFGTPGEGPELREGMVFAIEPMINVGTHKVKVGGDKWTVSTADKSLSAHFEHTVALTGKGPRILTRTAAADQKKLDEANVLW